jgi:hypothetical protein
MIAGTIFYPIIGKQQQAYSESDVRHKLRGDEQAVRSSLEHRNQNQQQQHMDQEDLCLRTGECKNSGVGEHTLGNDNSVTGFADQSNNTQAEVSVLPVTPTQPTPSGGGGGPPPGNGVDPIMIKKLGYENGLAPPNGAWEWDRAQYNANCVQNIPAPTTDRLITVTSPVKEGLHALKATVYPSDKHYDNVNNNKCSGGGDSTRSEVVLSNHPFKDGQQDVWYHWYTMFPNDFQTTSRFQVWTQWHQIDSNATGPVPVVFDVDKHGNLLMIVNDKQLPWTGSLTPGVWHEMLFHVKWSTSQDGFVELWENGIKVVPKTPGPTLDVRYPDKNNPLDGVYLKQGLYLDPTGITNPQSIFHDGMQVVTCPADHDYYHPDTELCYTTPP